MTNPDNCRHRNIHWEDLFKESKKNKAYCVDCGIDKGRSFASRCQLWYVKQVKEWLASNGLAEKKTVNNIDYYFCNKFIEFVKKNNYEQQWNDLTVGKTDKDFEGLGNGIGGQIIFWETAKSIEYLCQEFKKEKEQNPNPPKRERERERERLRKQVADLEKKTNRTAEEEAELSKKKKALVELEQNTGPPPHPKPEPFNWKPWVIGTVVGLGVGIIVYFSRQKKQK